MGPAHPGASVDGPCVYIDAAPFSDSRFTGLSRYTARLTLALARRVPVRFFFMRTELTVRAGLDWSQDQDLAVWSRRVWRSRREPLGPPPPNSIGLYGSLRPEERLFPFEISVLHDFSPLIVPTTHTERTRGMFRGYFAKTLLSSDFALADSHSTKADAFWLTAMAPERVEVAYPGPSLCVECHLHHKTVARRPNVGLVVSTLEPRKNAFFLLDWFHTTTVLPPDAELWWVGPRGWLTSRRDLNRLRPAGGGRRVRFLGVVSDQTLCRLYQTAGWSIYPSLYEGFGLPVLDALRHGTPVLTSYNSSLREFDSPGVFFFDPCDRSTVDRAWQRFESERLVRIPTEPLDQRYHWDLVARAVIEAPCRSRADAREPTTRAA